MISPADVKEYGGAIVAVIVGLAIGLEKPLRGLMQRNPVVQRVEVADQVSRDVVDAVSKAVDAAREKDSAAFKIVLDRMEARELHLTGQNEELLRQAATREAFHEREIGAARHTAAGAVEDAREARFELEKAALREKALQDAALAQERTHISENLALRRSLGVLRGQLEDYARRYGALGGRFTATDVLKGDDPP